MLLSDWSGDRERRSGEVCGLERCFEQKCLHISSDGQKSVALFVLVMYGGQFICDR